MGTSMPGEANESFSSLQTEADNLTLEEHQLDMEIREMQERVYKLSEDKNNQKLLFVTEDDIKGLPCFLNKTLIAIKAPRCTTLEVPYPNEDVDYPQGRYKIILRSTMGPIDVFLLSQFQEKSENINGVDVATNLPSDPELNRHPATVVTEDRGGDIEMKEQDCHGASTSPSASQDFVSGVMKVVPADIDADADYWLLSNADNCSISDLWRTEAGIGWNELDALNDDHFMPQESTAPPEIPPNTSQVPSTARNPQGG